MKVNIFQKKTFTGGKKEPIKLNIFVNSIRFNFIKLTSAMVLTVL